VKRPRTRLVRGLGAALLALGAVASAAGCQSLAGIEDRTLGPCSEFCDTVIANCSGQNLVYENRAKCMGVCQLLPEGKEEQNEPQGTNTVACRMREARLAKTSVVEDIPRHCRSAGPEGLDCGGSCENYCTLYEGACGEKQCGSHELCVAKCAALLDKPTFNLVDDYEGDTLQCRFVHLSNATIQPQPHCDHAQIVAPTAHCFWIAGEEDIPLQPDEPSCDDYCRGLEVGCTGVNSVYETHDQCMAMCAHFDPGEFTDTTQNTRGCRIYHSYNSLCGPTTHCPHAGPPGDGHCGDVETGNCDSYCRLAADICPDDFDASFTDEADCLDWCSGVDGHKKDSGYSLAMAEMGGDNLACRFLALSQAAEDDAACGAAFGDDPCN